MPSKEQLRQRSWRVDCNTANHLAISGTEVHTITSNQYVALQTQRGGKNRAIFFGQPINQLQFGSRCLCGMNSYSLKQFFQRTKRIWVFRGKIAARLDHHIIIHPAFLSCFDKQIDQLAYRTIGFGRGKKNIGVQKYAHDYCA